MLQSPLYKQLQMAGSFAACTLAKRCAAAAYARKKRAMMAGKSSVKSCSHIVESRRGVSWNRWVEIN